VALQSFSHVGVCVSDLERSTTFYEEVLGFRQLFTMSFADELRATMEIDGRFESRMLVRDDVLVELLHWIEPEASGDRGRRPMDRFGMTHLCFRVDDVDDHVDAAERFGGEAHQHTRTVLEGQGAGGGDVTLLYLTDPDGTRIELMAGSPDLRPR
jgi:glyoxylase I family protein